MDSEINYIDYEDIAKRYMVKESMGNSIKLDSSLIDVDLEHYIQLRIIHNDTDSLIVPQNHQSLIQIPNDAKDNHRLEYHGLDRGISRLVQGRVPINFLEAIFRYFAIPVTAMYLVEHADDRNGN